MMQFKIYDSYKRVYLRGVFNTRDGANKKIDKLNSDGSFRFQVKLKPLTDKALRAHTSTLAKLQARAA